eukprot:9596350-Lingulodinium_polyedra.AAC.1
MYESRGVPVQARGFTDTRETHRPNAELANDGRGVPALKHHSTDGIDSFDSIIALIALIALTAWLAL